MRQAKVTQVALLLLMEKNYSINSLHSFPKTGPLVQYDTQTLTCFTQKTAFNRSDLIHNLSLLLSVWERLSMGALISPH